MYTLQNNNTETIIHTIKPHMPDGNDNFLEMGLIFYPSFVS